MKKRFKLSSEVILIAVLLIISGALFLYFKGMGNGDSVAQITINGNEIMRIDLNQDKEQIIDLNPQYNIDIKLEIKDNAIAIIHSDCPDQICLGYGYISKEPQSSVCMPNRVAVVIM